MYTYFYFCVSCYIFCQICGWNITAVRLCRSHCLTVSSLSLYVFVASSIPWAISQLTAADIWTAVPLHTSVRRRYVNMVLDNVTEMQVMADGSKIEVSQYLCFIQSHGNFFLVGY